MEKPSSYEFDFRPPREESLVWLTLKIFIVLIFAIGLFSLAYFSWTIGIYQTIGKIQTFFKGVGSLMTTLAFPLAAIALGAVWGMLNGSSSTAGERTLSRPQAWDEEEENEHDLSSIKSTSNIDGKAGSMRGTVLGLQRVDISQGISTNIYSGDTYIRTGAFMTSSTGETYTEIGDGLWTDSHNKMIQRQGNEFVNVNTGIRSSFGDPFKD